MGYKSLNEVPELDIGALPIEDGFAIAKIIDIAEIGYRNGFSMGTRGGEVIKTDIIVEEMRYVVGKDSQRGRLYALAHRNRVNGDTARLDPEMINRDIWLALDSITHYNPLTKIHPETD